MLINWYLLNGKKIFRWFLALKIELSDNSVLCKVLSIAHGPIERSLVLCQFTKYTIFLWVSWFLIKNYSSNILSHPIVNLITNITKNRRGWALGHQAPPSPYDRPVSLCPLLYLPEIPNFIKLLKSKNFLPFFSPLSMKMEHCKLFYYRSKVSIINWVFLMTHVKDCKFWCR